MWSGRGRRRRSGSSSSSSSSSTRRRRRRRRRVSNSIDLTDNCRHTHTQTHMPNTMWPKFADDTLAPVEISRLLGQTAAWTAVDGFSNEWAVKKGAFRRGFCGPAYCNYDKEPPKIV